MTERATHRLNGLRVCLTSLDALEREVTPLDRPHVTHTIGLVMDRIAELERRINEADA